MMENILDELYDLCSEIEIPDNPERQKRKEEYFALGKRIQDTFGLEFLDQYNLLRLELAEHNDMKIFRKGFCLGARLMLEVFTPA